MARRTPSRPSTMTRCWGIASRLNDGDPGPARYAARQAARATWQADLWRFLLPARVERKDERQISMATRLPTSRRCAISTPSTAAQPSLDRSQIRDLATLPLGGTVTPCCCSARRRQQDAPGDRAQPRSRQGYSGAVRHRARALLAGAGQEALAPGALDEQLAFTPSQALIVVSSVAVRAPLRICSSSSCRGTTDAAACSHFQPFRFRRMGHRLQRPRRHHRHPRPAAPPPQPGRRPSGDNIDCARRRRRSRVEARHLSSGARRSHRINAPTAPLQKFCRVPPRAASPSPHGRRPGAWALLWTPRIDRFPSITLGSVLAVYRRGACLSLNGHRLNPLPQRGMLPSRWHRCGRWDMARRVSISTQTG